MLKWLGIGIILMSAGALGDKAANTLCRHYKALQELRMLMELLKGELQYGGTPMSEIFRRLSERWKSPLGYFFLETAEEMERAAGSPFKEILRKTAVRLKDTGLLEEEQEHLVQICGFLGEMDRETQIHTLEGYLFSIRQEEKIALEKRKQKETMYRCMGIMGGLFFAVLFY